VFECDGFSHRYSFCFTTGIYNGFHMLIHNLLIIFLGMLMSIFQEFPFVRFRAARSLDVTTMTTSRDLIPTKLAARIWDSLTQYKQKIENFPQTETCELLILDRSIDQVFKCTLLINSLLAFCMAWFCCSCANFTIFRLLLSHSCMTGAI
jgi:hypothetical protein